VKLCYINLKDVVFLRHSVVCCIWYIVYSTLMQCFYCFNQGELPVLRCESDAVFLLFQSRGAASVAVWIWLWNRCLADFRTSAQTCEWSAINRLRSLQRCRLRVCK